MPLIIKTTGFEEFLDPSGASYVKALIMGDHGVGKTPSAACWPKPIFADCEAGLMSVADKGVPYSDIKTSADMEALLDHLRLEGLKPVEKRRYQTLVIDTVDSYQRRLIQERLRTERKEALSGWADWGWLDAKMTQLIERMLNLPMNIVVNMHVKDVSDEDGDNSVLVKKARLKGDIKDSIFQDFDLIGQMEQSYVAGEGDKKGERVRVRQIRWHSEPRFPSLRDRSNKLPRFTDVDFTDQDFYRIFDTITADLDSLPESTELESLATETDTEPAGSDDKGGPVDSPTLPRKAPAKKTAAKKAAPAKKATVSEVVTEPAEDPWQPPAETAAGNGLGTADEPAILPVDTPMAAEARIVAKLQHVHTAEGKCLKNQFGELCGGDPTLDEAVTAATEALGAEPVTEPVAEPVATPVATPPRAAPEQKPAAKVARVCGDQPDSMKGKHEPVPGCGTPLTQANASKSQIAMLRLKTYLCDNCSEAAKKS